MKKLLAFVAAATTLFALSPVSIIPEDQKAVVAKVVEETHLPDTEENRQIVYSRLKPFFDAKEWNVRWLSNDSGADSKVKEGPTYFCDMTIYNENRIVNETFIYFSKKKQLFINVKEYIDTDSQSALKLYKQYNENAEYRKGADSEHYAYFQEKGRMSYTAFHLKGNVAIVNYETAIFIDIK